MKSGCVIEKLAPQIAIRQLPIANRYHKFPHQRKFMVLSLKRFPE